MMLKMFLSMKKIKITKREELVLSSAILTSLMLCFYIIPVGLLKFSILPVLIIVVYLASLFIGREGLRKIEYYLLPVLPVLFTISSALFYNIIPERWLTRLAFIFTYGFLIYSIFLIINIFNAAKLKNIQLLKVARTIYFFISDFTLFLFAYVVLSFHWYNFASSMLIGIFTFLISLTFIWSFSLRQFLIKEEYFLSFFSSLIIFELTFAITFWPLNIYLISLFITSVYYSITGILNNILSFKVRGWNLFEYALINVVIFLLCLMSVNFG
jgi:hypothetical protein